MAAEANAKGGDAAAAAKEGEVVTSGAVLLTGAGAPLLLHAPEWGVRRKRCMHPVFMTWHALLPCHIPQAGVAV